MTDRPNAKQLAAGSKRKRKELHKKKMRRLSYLEKRYAAAKKKIKLLTQLCEASSFRRRRR